MSDVSYVSGLLQRVEIVGMSVTVKLGKRYLREIYVIH